MDEFVLNVFETVLFACGSDITLLIPVAFDDAVDCGDEDVAADVELALVVEEWVLHVLLDQCRTHPVG